MKREDYSLFSILTSISDEVGFVEGLQSI